MRNYLPALPKMRTPAQCLISLLLCCFGHNTHSPGVTLHTVCLDIFLILLGAACVDEFILPWLKAVADGTRDIATAILHATTNSLLQCATHIYAYPLALIFDGILSALLLSSVLLWRWRLREAQKRDPKLTFWSFITNASNPPCAQASEPPTTGPNPYTGPQIIVAPPPSAPNKTAMHDHGQVPATKRNRVARPNPHFTYLARVKQIEKERIDGEIRSVKATHGALESEEATNAEQAQAAQAAQAALSPEELRLDQQARATESIRVAQLEASLARLEARVAEDGRLAREARTADQTALAVEKARATQLEARLAQMEAQVREDCRIAEKARVAETTQLANNALDAQRDARATQLVNEKRDARIAELEDHVVQLASEANRRRATSKSGSKQKRSAKDSKLTSDASNKGSAAKQPASPETIATAERPIGTGITPGEPNTTASFPRAGASFTDSEQASQGISVLSKQTGSPTAVPRPVSIKGSPVAMNTPAGADHTPGVDVLPGENVAMPTHAHIRTASPESQTTAMPLEDVAIVPNPGVAVSAWTGDSGMGLVPDSAYTGSTAPVTATREDAVMEDSPLDPQDNRNYGADDMEPEYSPPPMPAASGSANPHDSDDMDLQPSPPGQVHCPELNMSAWTADPPTVEAGEAMEGVTHTRSQQPQLQQSNTQQPIANGIDTTNLAMTDDSGVRATIFVGSPQPQSQRAPTFDSTHQKREQPGPASQPKSPKGKQREVQVQASAGSLLEMNRSQASIALTSLLRQSNEDLQNFPSGNLITLSNLHGVLRERLDSISEYCGYKRETSRGWRWKEQQIAEVSARKMTALAEELLTKLREHKTKHCTALANSKSDVTKDLRAVEWNCIVLKSGTQAPLPAADNTFIKDVEMEKAPAAVAVDKVNRPQQKSGSLAVAAKSTHSIATTNPTTSPSSQATLRQEDPDLNDTIRTKFSGRAVGWLQSTKDILDKGLTPKDVPKFRQVFQNLLDQIAKHAGYHVGGGQSFKWQSHQIEDEAVEKCSRLAYYISLMLTEHEKEAEAGSKGWTATLQAHCCILYEAGPDRASFQDVADVIFEANLHMRSFDELTAQYGFVINSMVPLETVLGSDASQKLKSAAILWWFEYQYIAIANHNTQTTIRYLTTRLLNTVLRPLLQWVTAKNGYWDQQKIDIRIAHRLIAITDRLLTLPNYNPNPRIREIRRCWMALDTQAIKLKASIIVKKSPTKTQTE